MIKLFNFCVEDEVRLGADCDGKLVDLTATMIALGMEEEHIPTTTDEVIWTEVLPEIRLLAARPDAVPIVGAIHFAPSLCEPEKILCIGKNYREHAAEMGGEPPKTPEVFSKLPNCLNAHGCDILLPATAEKYDYEAELCVVIGRECFDVSAEEAENCIFGYTGGMDFSVREVQKRQSQWLLGKCFDGGCPLGPVIVPKEDIDARNLRIRCLVNGEERQCSNTGMMIFSPAELVSYISQYMTLFPGDCILTGTPAGVMMGYPAEKQVWLKDGDVVEVEIEGIGTLRNTMKKK